MVKNKRIVTFGLIVGVLCVSLSLCFVSTARAQVTYGVSNEWIKAWINSDGSVDILYNVTFSYFSGSPQGLFDLGMPNPGFQIHYVEDLSGAALKYQDISSSGYTGIEITLRKPIVLNQPITFSQSNVTRSYPANMGTFNFPCVCSNRGSSRARP